MLSVAGVDPATVAATLQTIEERLALSSADPATYADPTKHAKYLYTLSCFKSLQYSLTGSRDDLDNAFESVFSTDGFFGFIGVRLEPLPNSSRSVWNHQTASKDGKKETNETVQNQDGAIISRLGKACNFRSRISPSRHQGTLGKSHHVTTSSIYHISRRRFTKIA
jgi:hypothetical protein